MAAYHDKLQWKSAYGSSQFELQSTMSAQLDIPQWQSSVAIQYFSLSSISQSISRQWQSTMAYRNGGLLMAVHNGIPQWQFTISASINNGSPPGQQFTMAASQDIPQWHWQSAYSRLQVQLQSSMTAPQDIPPWQTAYSSSQFLSARAFSICCHEY